MLTRTQTDIHVPALMDGNRVIVPHVWLGKDVEYRTDMKNNALSAAEYNSQIQLPTLAELRHAYFDRTNGQEMIWHQEEKGDKLLWIPDYDDWVSLEYRESVVFNRGKSEFTSVWLRNRKEIIERPEKVFYDQKSGLWIAEGGKVTSVELPPDDWVLEYDKPTGFPSRTSWKRKDAEKVFGDDTSYFYAIRNGTRAVLRDFDLYDNGPFYVVAYYGPDNRNSDIGGRAS